MIPTRDSEEDCRVAATDETMDATTQTGPQPALRVLMVTGAYPTLERPHWAPFIKSQVESLREAGCQVDVLQPRPGPTPLRYLEAWGRVVAAMHCGRYDLVHGHYGLWCLVARLQWRVPVVAAFLGSDLLGDPAERGGATMRGKLTTIVSRWLANHVDAVIVKSPDMARHLSRPDVHVLANGVDFAVFRPQPRALARASLGLNPAGYYVLFGNDPRLPRKNFPLAHAAVQRLRERGLAVELLVANGLPQERVATYLNASNALILTSLHEGSPNIVKEAMACNVPVVATDVGDVREVISRTEGCAVCPRDAGALAAALEIAVQRERPTSGRPDIAHLDRRVVAQKLVRLYVDVIHRSRQGDTRTSRRATRDTASLGEEKMET